MKDLNPKLVDLVPQIEDTFEFTSYIHNNYLVEFFLEKDLPSFFSLALNKDTDKIHININIDYSTEHMIDFLTVFSVLKEHLIKDLEIGRAYYIDNENSYHFDVMASIVKYRELTEEVNLLIEEASKEDETYTEPYTFISRDPLKVIINKENLNKKGKK